MSYIGANSQGIIGVANTDIIDGSTISNATLDSTVTFPAGTVLQVVHTETTETNTLDSTFTNYYEVPLTLKSSSSNVIVSFTFQYEFDTASGAGIQIYRKNSSGVTTSDTAVWTKNAANANGPYTLYSNTSALNLVSTVTGKDVLTGVNAGDTLYYALFAKRYGTATFKFPVSAPNEDGFFSSLIMEIQK